MPKVWLQMPKGINKKSLTIFNLNITLLYSFLVILQIQNRNWSDLLKNKIKFEKTLIKYVNKTSKRKDILWLHLHFIKKRYLKICSNSTDN